MNKLILEEDINNLKNCNHLIEFHQSTTINVTGKVELSNYSRENHNLEINLNDNGILKLTKVNIVNKNTSITINQSNNTILDFNFLIINEGHNTITITLNMKGNNSKSTIKVRVINKSNNSHANVICNGKVFAHTIDNELLEDLKGLVLGHDMIKISPNMSVLTEEVMANHLVTIGSFNNQELFYLTSRGLSLETAKKLLIRSYTSNILNPELKEILKNGGDFLA